MNNFTLKMMKTYSFLQNYRRNVLKALIGQPICVKVFMQNQMHLYSSEHPSIFPVDTFLGKQSDTYIKIKRKKQQNYVI